LNDQKPLQTKFNHKTHLNNHTRHHTYSQNFKQQGITLGTDETN